MVSLYIKAGAITLILFLLGMYVVKYFDDQRLAKLEGDIESVSREMQETQQLMLYMQVFGDSNGTSLCPIIESKVRTQSEKIYELSSLMRQYEEANILSSYERVKESYFIANTELFLYSMQEVQLCNHQNISHILFFYDDKQKCEDCIVQGGILDQVRSQCSNVRVFAFPVSTQLDVVEVLSMRYNITSAPSLVIKNATYSKLMPVDEVKALVNCT